MDLKDIRYGIAICKEEISMYVWDGSNDMVSFKVGDELVITYHEQDGSLGLTKDGVEVCCRSVERKCFEEKWDNNEKQR